MGSKGKGGGRGGGGGGNFFLEVERLANFAQIPTSFSHELRACLGCRLVKTYDQGDLFLNVTHLRSLRSFQKNIRSGSSIPHTLRTRIPPSNICTNNNVQYVPPKRSWLGSGFLLPADEAEIHFKFPLLDITSVGQTSSMCWARRKWR